jgi:hypothetical protein
MTGSLLSELRRSADAETRRVGDLLAPLVAADQVRRPRASEALASFLAAQDSPVGSTSTELASGPADLVVVLGPPLPPNRAPRRRPWVPALLQRSLLAKVVLAATVALAGGVAVAATTGPSGGDTVVITPAATSEPPASVGTDDHEGRAHVAAPTTHAPSTSTKAHSTPAGRTTKSPVADHGATPGPTSTAGSTDAPRHHDDPSPATTAEPSQTADPGDDGSSDGETPTGTPTDDPTPDGGDSSDSTQPPG